MNTTSGTSRQFAHASNVERVSFGLVAIAIGSVLVIAARLTPAAQGFGTHRQVGLKDCAWAMWFKKPCMTCGMTTSFAYAADGEFIAGFFAQPAGLLLCLASAVAFWVCLDTALTGSRLAPTCLRRVRGSTIVTIVGILAVAWMYKYFTWPNS